MVISQKSLRLLLLVLLTVTGTRWQDPEAELEASRRGIGDGSCCSFGPLQTAGRETPNTHVYGWSICQSRRDTAALMSELPALLAEQSGSGTAAPCPTPVGGPRGEGLRGGHRRRHPACSRTHMKPFRGRLGAVGVTPGPERFSPRLGEFWLSAFGAVARIGSPG